MVANQVADRFAPISTTTRSAAAPSGPTNLFSSSPASTASNAPPTPSVLTLDHQQRFFTGWGAHPSSVRESHNLKTPSLGLVWTNQIACRVALVKERDYGGSGTGEGEVDVGVGGGAEWNSRRWRRWMRIAFAGWVGGTGEGDWGVEFEIWRGGVRAVELASAASTEDLV